jgi:hypothetical protein
MLTEREKRFVAALAAGMTGTEAARAAGYSSKSLAPYASRLRRKPHIAAELEALGVGPIGHAEPADPAIASSAEQQRLLSSIARDAKADAKDRVRAIAVLHALQRRPASAPEPAPLPPRARFHVTHDPAPDAPAADPKTTNLH